MRKDMQDPYVTVDAIPGIDILLVSDPKKHRTYNMNTKSSVPF